MVAFGRHAIVRSPRRGPKESASAGRLAPGSMISERSLRSPGEYATVTAGRIVLASLVVAFIAISTVGAMPLH